MTPEFRQKLKGLLVKHENYREFPYIDTTGHMTIGIGRNLSSRGISTTEAIVLLDDDIIWFNAKLSYKLPWFDNLSDARKIVLIDMAFNLGLEGLLSFDKMLQNLQDQDYSGAANEMLNSRWANQVGERAHELAEIMLKDDV